MYVSAKSVKDLHCKLLLVVKEKLVDIPPFGTDKHAFHESAHLEIISPDSSINPIHYDGITFSTEDKEKLLALEIGHYNTLIVPDDINSLVTCLADDRGSKKAYLTLWDNKDIFGRSGEIPCMTGVHFYVRNNLLQAVVHMRSNEAYKLLPIDMYIGMAMQTYIAKRLEMSPGSYTHQVGSLVLYSVDMPYLLSV